MAQEGQNVLNARLTHIEADELSPAEKKEQIGSLLKSAEEGKFNYVIKRATAMLDQLNSQAEKTGGDAEKVEGVKELDVEIAQVEAETAAQVQAVGGGETGEIDEEVKEKYATEIEEVAGEGTGEVDQEPLKDISETEPPLFSKEEEQQLQERMKELKQENQKLLLQQGSIIQKYLDSNDPALEIKGRKLRKNLTARFQSINEGASTNDRDNYDSEPFYTDAEDYVSSETASALRYLDRAKASFDQRRDHHAGSLSFDDRIKKGMDMTGEDISKLAPDIRNRYEYLDQQVQAGKMTEEERVKEIREVQEEEKETLLKHYRQAENTTREMDHNSDYKHDEEVMHKLRDEEVMPIIQKISGNNDEMRQITEELDANDLISKIEGTLGAEAAQLQREIIQLGRKEYELERELKELNTHGLGYKEGKDVIESHLEKVNLVMREQQHKESLLNKLKKSAIQETKPNDKAIGKGVGEVAQESQPEELDSQVTTVATEKQPLSPEEVQANSERWLQIGQKIIDFEKRLKEAQEDTEAHKDLLKYIKLYEKFMQGDQGVRQEMESSLSEVRMAGKIDVSNIDYFRTAGSARLSQEIEIKLPEKEKLFQGELDKLMAERESLRR